MSSLRIWDSCKLVCGGTRYMCVYIQDAFGLGVYIIFVFWTCLYDGSLNLLSARAFHSETKFSFPFFG